jgi:hypothetical protein
MPSLPSHKPTVPFNVSVVCLLHIDVSTRLSTQATLSLYAIDMLLEASHLCRVRRHL